MLPVHPQIRSVYRVLEATNHNGNNDLANSEAGFFWPRRIPHMALYGWLHRCLAWSGPSFAGDGGRGGFKILHRRDNTP